ncbi:MAG: RDD family protein [Pseudomonadota bacterium]
MEEASLWRRLGAIIYDALLLLAILFAVTLPLIALRDGDPIESGNLLYQGLLIGAAYTFFVGFWWRYGRTLGMQSWRLRIEAPDGGEPPLSACSLRFATALLSWLPCGLGFLWQLVDRDKLSWHDRLSGTRLRYYPKAPKSASSG